jgi:hypothetical protein
MRKFLVSAFAAAALTASAFTMSEPARADVDVDVFITPGPGFFYVPPRGYRSCRVVAQELYRRGYHNIRVVDCRGRVYAYRARRDGRSYVVRISSRSGNIVDRQRVNY